MDVFFRPCSEPWSSASNLHPLEPDLDISRDEEDENTRQHDEATEQLEAQIVAMSLLHKSTANGTSSEGTKRLDGKGGANTGSDLANIGDLGDESRAQTGEATGREAKDDGEDDDAHGVLDGNPDSETEERRDERDDNHDVVSTDLVGNDAWNDTAKDATEKLGADLSDGKEYS